MTQREKLELVIRLLKELNCPEELLSAIEIFGIFVHNDDTKLQNWLSVGGVVEGEAREL